VADTKMSRHIGTTFLVDTNLMHQGHRMHKNAHRWTRQTNSFLK